MDFRYVSELIDLVEKFVGTQCEWQKYREEHNVNKQNWDSEKENICAKCSLNEWKINVTNDNDEQIETTLCDFYDNVEIFTS